MLNEKKEAEAKKCADVSEIWYEMNDQFLFGVTAA